MSGMGGPGMPGWLLGEPLGGQDWSAPTPTQLEINLRSAEQVRFAAAQQNYAQVYAPLGTITMSHNEYRDLKLGLREPVDVPDWVPPTPAQWWALAVFVAIYGLFVAAFYIGFP